MDISFLYSYKGTLYPVEDAGEDGRGNTSGPVASLLDLVCRTIVKDSSSTERALAYVPADLCYDLMKAALRDTRDRTIEVLVSRWPGTVLQLSRFVPPLFEDLGALYNDRYLGEQMRRGVKYTTCLAHTFVECLKKRAPTSLRCLDLSGYPAAEVIVNYLSSHVLLVYNEVRQQEIISMYNEVTGRLPQDQRHTYQIENTLPDNNTYVIVVDAFLFSNDTHMELCRALKTSRAGTSSAPEAAAASTASTASAASRLLASSSAVPLRLRLSKLDLSCFGVARISVLLEQVDVQFLTALCLQYNSIGDEGLLILCPALQRLTSLTALDISCNNIYLGRADNAAILQQTLNCLPRLSRLDLSNNRTKYWLGSILPGSSTSTTTTTTTAAATNNNTDEHSTGGGAAAAAAAAALQYLRLCGCGLGDADLGALMRSHHASHLRHLDLSENTLGGERLAAFLGLLRSIAGQLAVLEVENCALGPDDLAQFFGTCRSLQALRFLNLSRNDSLTTDLILAHLETYASMLKLEVLRMSFPRECYELSENDEAVEAFKETLSHRLTAMLNSMCERKGRNTLKFVLTQSSFDLI